MSALRAHTAVLLLSLLATAGRGQRPTQPPSARAEQLLAPPVVDGRILEDPVWQELEPITHFWQVRPDEGASASERTEVRIGYTAETLYVAVVCFDRDADAIIISDARRDASLDDTDSFRFVVDTFRDEQNGFLFGTNPAGIQYDGQIKNASDQAGLGGSSGSGGSGRFRRGSGSGFNLNWDAVWSVESRRGPYGWSAEFAIPFRSIRYPTEGKEQSWGVNFQRNIRRHNETSFWAPLDRQYNIFRLAAAGTIENLRPPRPRNLQIAPYVLAEARDEGGADGDEESTSEVGVDVKYSVTPALTLDVTYNTDFAQVEVDEQQVNLDRFNLFFPEKRPFFLENAGLFTVGDSGVVDLFFSRRIGISEDGDPIPILGGGRLSGKVGRHTNIGFLAMRTEEVVGIDDANNFGVARLSHTLPNRSNLGMLFVTREGTGSGVAADDENQTFGIDGQLGVGEHLTLSAFAARTRTPGLDGDEHAFQLEADFAAPKWRWDLGYLEVGDDFNPEVGFLARDGFRSPSGRIERRVRPKKLLGLYELRPHISYNGHWDFDGFQESGFLHIDNHWEWASGARFTTAVNFTLEGVKEPFEIADGIIVPPGTYEHDEILVAGGTDAGAPVSLSVLSFIGGFFGGDRVSVDTTLKLRRGELLTSEITWSHNNVNLPWGDFDTNLGRLRLSYSLSTDLLLQALVQYNDTNDDVSTNLRFIWLRKANTGLFVVYNEIREYGRAALPSPGRSVIVKYSHLFDVFR